MVLYRETELLSEIGDLIQIKVVRQYAFPGADDGSIEIPRYGGRKIPARNFHNGSVLSNRGTTLKIFINGVDSGKLLIPQHFIQYARLVFRVEYDEENRSFLAVYGIRAKLTDFGRVKGLGFLLEANLRDRDYERII